MCPLSSFIGILQTLHVTLVLMSHQNVRAAGAGARCGTRLDAQAVSLSRHDVIMEPVSKFRE
jgi:hypothetical protein